MSDSITAALRAVATCGDFFDLRPDSLAQSHRLVDLAESELLDNQIERTGTALAQLRGLRRADVPRRVIVSLISLGVAARVVSPALATSGVAGVVADLSPSRLRTRMAG